MSDFTCPSKIRCFYPNVDMVNVVYTIVGKPRGKMLPEPGTLTTSAVGLLRVSEYSDIRGSEYKIEYGYSALPKSLDRDLFFSSFF